MLLDGRFRQRGMRKRVLLTVTTLQPILMPNAGRDASAWLAGQLDDRGIVHRAGAKVKAVEAGRVLYEDSALDFDIVIGVPPHRPPAVVRRSGLTGDGDWIATDPATLRTSFDGVFAIGDCTHIPLANGLSLPKAGIFAELQGARVAATIAAELSGEAGAPAFDGHGHCFVEMGPDTAALVEGQFYAEPEPHITLRDVSAANSADKHAFESDRLKRWFGA
jgi:sulfide:quinone oxidoreductase